MISPDAPPDAGAACRVGFSWLPWVATEQQPSAAVVADVNHDGMPDLIVSMSATATVSVRLGSGGGRFQSGIDYAIRAMPTGLSTAVADVNRDGKLDLIAAAGDVSVLLGNGDGTFQAKIDSPTGGVASVVVVGDVDGDDKLDLVVINAQIDQVSVLPGHGDGTFGTAVDYATVSQPGPLSLVDLSGDGKPDIVVGSTQTPAVTVLLNSGTGTFPSRTDYPVTNVVSAMAVADVSGDGVLDIVAVGHTLDDPQGNALFGKGDGTFPRRVDFQTNTFAVAVAAVDLDGNGVPDLITVDDDGDVGVQFRDTVSLWRFHGRFQVGAFSRSLALGDVSGDGKLDLLVANIGGNNISVELGDGNGGFLDMPSPAGPAAFFFLADVDHDGKLDAVGPGTGASVALQLGNGDGTFRAPAAQATDLAPTFAVPADVNHDGKLDIVTWNDASSPASASVSVLLGNGDGTFQAKVDQPVDRGATAIATADLDGNGNADLVAAFAGDKRVRVLLGNGDGTFRNGTDYPAATAPGAIVTADVNGDGKPDLAAILGGTTVAVRLGQGDGTFGAQVDYTVGVGANLLTAADVTGDGKLDLLVEGSTASEDNIVTVLRGVGDGTFVPRGSDPVNVFPDAMSVADVTGDGKPDLVLFSRFARTLSILPGDGTGAFGPRIDYGAATTRTAISVADVTGDGRPDVLLSGGPMFVATCLP